MLHSKERITEFIDTVLSTDEAFTITDGASSPDWYIQTRIGKSKFIYETKSYHGEDDARIPGFNAEFVAMVTDGKVYMGTPVSYFMSGCERPKILSSSRRRPLQTRRKASRWWMSFIKR